MKKKKATITHNVEWHRLQLLLIAAYMLGQEQGLQGKSYDHPDCKNHRDNLISFVFNGKLNDK